MSTEKRCSQSHDPFNIFLQTLAEYSKPWAAHQIDVLARMQSSIKTFKAQVSDQSAQSILDHASAMVLKAQGALLRQNRAEGLALALKFVWAAGYACAAATGGEQLKEAIRRAPEYLQAMRRSSAKAWAAERHGQLMADEYARYRDRTQKEKAQRLHREWAKRPGKSRLDKQGNIKPSAKTFERYLRDF